MVSLQRLFIPDGQKFYKLFDEVADNLQNVSHALYAAIYNTDDKFTEHLNRLDELERMNDDTTHRLFVALGKNFITPFDREDIHYLISGLDDIADISYGIARQINSYGLHNPGNTSQYVAGEYKRYITLLTDVINKFKNKRSLSDLVKHCRDMKKIVGDCNARIDTAVAGLFPAMSDPIDIIKRMEHYELMYVLIDKCENAVNVIESIIIKYG